MQERHQQIEEAIARLEDGIAECERELQSFVSARKRRAGPNCWPSGVTNSNP